MDEEPGPEISVVAQLDTREGGVIQIRRLVGMGNEYETSESSLSEGEEGEEEEINPELLLPVHLQMHKNAMDDVKERWRVQPLNGDTFVRTPSASRIVSSFLHPATYRLMKKISSAEEFAELIDVGDWREKVDLVLDNQTVLRARRRFVQSDSSVSESALERMFERLVVALADTLGVECDTSEPLRFGIGGLLAYSDYFIHGKTDNTFMDSDGGYLLKTEAKTQQSFPTGHLWYRGSRGAQTLGCLYSSGDRVPVILYTSKQFKLFIESKERDSIFTFPSHPTLHNSEGTESHRFIEILVICLLASNPVSPVSAMERKMELIELSQVPTASKSTISERRPARIAEKKGDISRPQSKFVTNQPQPGQSSAEFQTVTTLSQDELERLLLLKLPEEDTTGNGDKMNIVSAPSDLMEMTAEEVMTPISSAFSLDLNAKLDLEAMGKIFARGYSRVPVYEGSRQNVIGVLLVESLNSIRPETETSVSAVCIKGIPRIPADMPLFYILNEFVHESFMAAVVKTKMKFDESSGLRGLDESGNTREEGEQERTPRSTSQSNEFGVQDIEGGEVVGIITCDIIEELFNNR